MKKLLLIVNKRNALYGMILKTLLLSSTLIGQPVLADALPYYQSAEFTPHWLEANSNALKGFHQIPKFSLVNQEGETVSQKNVARRIYVASFFFSSCPGICPTIRSKLTKVQDAFLESQDVLILSHSIRPTTDTPEILRAYAQRNDIRSNKWQLLTGDRQAIYALARDAYFVNEDLGNIQDLSNFLHTESLLLIDQNRHIRGVYNGLSSASVANLISDISTLQRNTAENSAPEEEAGAD